MIHSSQNVVACGAGFADGLGYGDNTKAAVIRLGSMEMTKVSLDFDFFFSKNSPIVLVN